MKKKWIASAIAICAISVSQSAIASDIAVGVRASTLGISGEMVTNVIPGMLNARLQLNGFSYNKNISDTKVKYDGKLKLLTAGALADFYPFSGKFRISAGLYYNANKITVTAIPTVAQTFTINNTTYSTTDIGSISGKIDFNKVAPYLGIGWGDAISSGSPFGFSLEAGALYQGTPKTSLNTSGVNPLVANQIANDIAVEKKKLDDSLKNFKLYPVIAIGVNYKF